MTSQQASGSTLPDRPDARPAALRPLWAARGVAVVGASDRAGSVGRLPVQFLQRYGYRGGIYPVRPDGAPVAGLTSYPSVAEAARAGEVDAAMVMVAADKVVAAVRDCAAAGVGVVIVCSSGFAETGEAGAALQDELVRVAGELGVRVLGPNCIGTVGTGTGQVSSFSPLFSGSATELVPGPIGFVSQSGALGYGAVSLAFERGLGLGWVVNTGNEADIGATEVMAALAQEDGCTGLLGYAESLGDLAALARVTAAGIPVAMLKAGRSDAGARAAASHTGALATGDKVVDAALRRAGVVRVDDVDELLDVGDVMTLVPRVRDRQDGRDGSPARGSGASVPAPGGSHLRTVAVVTTSGGSGILAADAIEARGLELAALAEETLAELDEIVPAYGSTANPVDVTASVMSNPDLFDRALTTIARDPGVDAIVACFCVLTGSDVDAVVEALARVRERTGVPVVVTRTGADHLAPEASATMRAAGLPVYPTPARAVRAVAALAQFLEAGRAADDGDRAVDAAGSGAGGRPANSPADLWAHPDESSLKQALGRAGLPVPVGRLVTDRDDALAAVEQAGGRTVFKAAVPGLLHKSDAGGVVLDVTADRAAEVYDRLAALRGPDGSTGQVLVEEMVPEGVEVLVGSADTPLGRILTVGVGGVLTEVVADVALRMLPVDRHDVEEMVDETRLAMLLGGVRGRPAADRDALVDTVVALAGLASTLPPGAELDLNPITVLGDGDGVRILDAALALADEED